VTPKISKNTILNIKKEDRGTLKNE
jgi:hypothetical protein